jgi:adenylate kinase family enzyme
VFDIAMRNEGEAEALLLTGVYGSGKSTLCGFIGEELEARGLPFAAIDLDWLGWSNASPEGSMVATNLASIAANYRVAGVRYFILSHTIRNRRQLERLKAALGIPLRVVLLAVPDDEILRRLRADGCSQHDIDGVLEQFASPADPSLADVAIENTGPIEETVSAVLDWAGWPKPQR